MLSVAKRLQQRARIYKQIRAFFDVADFLEVDTPLLGTATNTDCHIQSIAATVNRRTAYLQTSPEFAMKRLLAEGSGSIYQICHAFRDEELGRLHHAEFTLLEWYSLGLDYRQLMQQMQALLAELWGEKLCIPQFSYAELFKRYLHIDLEQLQLAELRRCVTSHVGGVDANLLNQDDCLDLLISQVIAPQFNGFTFVYDYPASQASLARIKKDNPAYAERFELFYNDIELANGFTELTDANEQRARFEQDNEKRRSIGLQPYPLDEAFLKALQQGLPDCAGVALGLDRLLMIMMEQSAIGQVLALNTLE